MKSTYSRSAGSEMWMNNRLLQDKQSVKKFLSDSLQNNKCHFNANDNVQNRGENDNQQ